MRLLRVELEALELGDAVDDAGDVGTELGGDVVERDVRVLDGVVQQGGGDRDVVESEVGDDPPNGQWVLTAINAPVLRAIGFGLGLGQLAMAMRIWLSLERGTFFGGEE